MAVCGGITAGSAYDCDDPLISGMQPKVWLLNKSDIDTITYGANTSVVTAISLLAGGKASYVFDGYRQSANAEVEFVPQTLTSGYDHKLSLQVFDISSLQKLNLEKMALGKLVAIVENNNAVGNGDSVFEILGAGVGMEVETLTRINRDVETAGSFSVGLETSDNDCLLYTSPSPRDRQRSRMPSSA